MQKMQLVVHLNSIVLTIVAAGTMYMHFKDSDWHSTEGDKRDDLSSNAWFNKTQSLAGDKSLIKKTGNWACKRPIRL
jgi:hypothetical protein